MTKRIESVTDLKVTKKRHYRGAILAEGSGAARFFDPMVRQIEIDRGGPS